MKIQLVTFPECPIAETARTRLAHALSGLGLPPRFEEVDVLEREGIQAYRMPYDVGQYMTRLEMASFSIMLEKP